MADHRLIIGLGDSVCAGQTVAADLTGPYASLAASQSDFRIWDQQQQRWEDYNPGSNSYTVETGFDYFGPEINMRNALDVLFEPGEDLHILKMGIPNSALLSWDDAKNPDGSSKAGTDYLPWWPNAREAYSTLYANMVTAITDLLGGGANTVVVEGVYICMGLRDALAPAGADGFGELLLDFVNTLRADLETILSEVGGTFDDLPVVLVKIHDSFDYGETYSEADRARITTVRSEIEWVQQQGTGISVVRRDSVSLLPDQIHYGIDDNVAVGGDIISQFFDLSSASEPGEEPDDPIDVYLLIGDDQMEGQGAASELPAYLVGVGGVSGVQIWDPHHQDGAAFRTLELNVNNLTTHDFGASTPGYAGPNFGIADETRQKLLRTIHLIQLSATGAHGAQNNGLLSGGFPFYDKNVTDWNPASRNEFYQKLLQGWFQDAIDALQAANPDDVRLRGVFIALGTNDAMAQDGGLQAAELGSTLQAMIARIRNQATNIINKGETLPFALLMPDARLKLLDLTENHTDRVRAEVQKVADSDSHVGVYDPTDKHALLGDGIHFTGLSNLQIGQQLVNTLLTELSVNVSPLFVSTRDDLVNSIRLEGVPDDSNAQDVINHAIQTAKGHFYRRLGRSRILTLQSYAYSPTPSSEEQYIRLLANTTEVNWVRLELMRTMPLMFMDGNVPRQPWDDEAAFRAATAAQLARELKKINAEIDEAMSILTGEASATEDTTVQVKTIGPEDTPDGPGDSVKSQGGVL